MQYDKTIPIMEVDLYLNNVEYALPDELDVRVRWSKKDRTFVYKDILGCSTDRKSVYFEIDEQMSFYAGIVYPIIELKVSESVDDEIAGSGPIPVVIDPNPILDSDVESQSEFFDINPNADISQIRDAFILSLKKSYKEIYYTESKVSSIEIWDTSAKEIHLFTKTIEYDGEKVSIVITVDHTTDPELTLTKTITYLNGGIQIEEEVDDV